jgi:hypothetical protein
MSPPVITGRQRFLTLAPEATDQAGHGAFVEVELTSDLGGGLAGAPSLPEGAANW